MEGNADLTIQQVRHRIEKRKAELQGREWEPEEMNLLHEIAEGGEVTYQSLAKMFLQRTEEELLEFIEKLRDEAEQKRLQNERDALALHLAQVGRGD
jgi:hypothetical protein